MIALRFQQQGVHIRMTGDARSLSLNSLGAPYLQPLRRGIGVERHILCLEGCRVVAILSEDTTESRSDDALTNIATRSREHQRM